MYVWGLPCSSCFLKVPQVRVVAYKLASTPGAVKEVTRVKRHLSVTYIVPPANFVYPRIRFDVALEEHIDALAQRGVQRIGSQLQTHHRDVCEWKIRVNTIFKAGGNRLSCHGIGEG